MSNVDESTFQSRKRDHVRYALDDTYQYGTSGLERIRLIHEALPDISLGEIDLSTQILGQNFDSPMYVNSMTAGHDQGREINERIAVACQARNWLMCLGSQRGELTNEVGDEWYTLRKVAPDVVTLGNIGIAQAIKSPTHVLRRLVESCGSIGLIIHLNVMQECIQLEGDENFTGGLKAIERIAKELEVPVVVKEVGFGMSKSTLRRLCNIGVAAVDISGRGGTNWTGIEEQRLPEGSLKRRAAPAFATWGIDTCQSVKNASTVDCDYEVWASGGVRDGTDVLKLLSMGVSAVGLAQPVLKAALAEEVDSILEQLEFELRVGILCVGCTGVADAISRGAEIRE